MTELFADNDYLQRMHNAEQGAEQYLSFSLGDEEYGLEILRVQEIKAWDRVTHIPNTPDYIVGVLNLHGSIVPLVDLRLRFGMSAREYSPTTVIIVLNVLGETKRNVGIVVDTVNDAYDVFPEEIRACPQLGSTIDTDFISGLVSMDDNMMMILNIDRLLSVEALG